MQKANPTTSYPQADPQLQSHTWMVLSGSADGYQSTTLDDADQSPPNTTLNYANWPHWHQPALSFSTSLERKQACKHTYTPPSLLSMAGTGCSLDLQRAFPSVPLCLLQCLNSQPTPLSSALLWPFLQSCPSFLIKQQKWRITWDTAQPCWDFTLSVGCQCPYNVGFFNLVSLLPAAAIQSAENKAPRLSGPTQWLCAFASGWTNNISVFQLQWKPFCCGSLTACVPLPR